MWWLMRSNFKDVFGVVSDSSFCGLSLLCSGLVAVKATEILGQYQQI